MNYFTFANSWVLWCSVLPVVFYALLQAVVLLRGAWSCAKEVGIQRRQLRTAAAASVAASIGPSIVIAINSIALVAVIGAPMAFLRLAYIGSITFELSAANFGAAAAGGNLSFPESITLEIFSTCCWVMCVASLGWIVISSLLTDRIDQVSNRITKGNAVRMAFFAGGGCIGAYSFLVASQVSTMEKGTLVATGTAFVIQTLISLYGKKTKAGWVSKWGLCISIFGAMLAAVLV